MASSDLEDDPKEHFIDDSNTESYDGLYMPGPGVECEVFIPVGRVDTEN